MPPRYFRLSFVYFLYFAILGIYFPYWSLYLSDLNFGPEAIAQIMAAGLISRLFVPYWWSWIGDSLVPRLKLIRVIAIILPINFALTIYFDTYLALLLILFIFGFFWHGLLPQLETLTLHSLGHQSHHYSTIRLWGSIGFIVFVIALAPLVEYQGTASIPILITLTLVAVAAMTFLLKSRKTFSSPRLDIKPFLKRPEILALLLICFLMQLSHGPYYTFFSLYLRTNGYSDAWIGQIWALGVIAEVVALLFMYRILPRWGAPIMLCAALVATTIRWILLAWFPDIPAVLVLIQLLHALTVGVYHAAAIHLIHFFFMQGVQGRGQALFSAVSFGAGGVIGTYAAGFLWERIGGTQVFLLAAVVSLLALPLVILVYRGICRS